MKLVCANSLTLGREIFEKLGEVLELPESEIGREALMASQAEALIVRSKTKVDAALLDGTAVKFVGTATAGTDHVDIPWLAEHGIAFSAAAGCNAASVGQYLTAALIYLAEKYDFDLRDKTLGIVGHGHVGKQVQRKAELLGTQILYSDPPLYDETGDTKYLPLKELVPQCDILTLHVPLIDDGPYPTRDFVTEEHLRAMPEGSFLINACRGEVVPTRAIASTLRDGHLQGAVLDVWNPEPGIPAQLLDLVDLGSAHIAGHSFEGKFNGTVLCYQAACAHFGIDPDLDTAGLIPEVSSEVLLLEADGRAISRAVSASYDINTDDHLLRESVAATDPIAAFKQLRSSYRLRREFEGTWVKLKEPHAEIEQTLRALGFAVQ